MWYVKNPAANPVSCFDRISTDLFKKKYGPIFMSVMGAGLLFSVHRARPYECFIFKKTNKAKWKQQLQLNNMNVTKRFTEEILWLDYKIWHNFQDFGGTGLPSCENRALVTSQGASRQGGRGLFAYS